MSRDRLLKVVGNSACLTKRQISDYVRQKLYPEELYVVEMHLNECPFCNDAIEGFSKNQEHFLMLDDLVMPELSAIPASIPNPKKTETPKEKPKKNTVVPAATVANHTVKVDNKNPFKNDRSHKSWFSWSIAAALLLGFGTLMYYKFGTNSPDNKPILADANNTTVTEESAAEILEPTISSNPADSMLNEMYRQTPEQETAPAVAAERNADAVRRDSAIALHKPIPAVTDAVKQKEQKTANLPPAALPSNSTAEVTVAANKSTSQASREKTLQADANTSSPKTDVPKRSTKVETTARTETRAATEDKTDDAKASDSKFERINADYKKGVDLYKKGQYGTALLYLQPSISNKKAPYHKQALNYAAKCHEEMGNNRKAERLREQAEK